MEETNKPAEKPPVKLTSKQQAFIEHYLHCWNAAEAARLAGYSEKTARQIGRENLTKPDILEAIVERLEDLSAGADEVVKRLTDHARGSMEDFLVIDDLGVGTIDLRQAQKRKQLHLIKKFKTTRRTLPEGGSEVTNELELYDAQTALSQLGRAHALFAERLLTDWKEQARREGHDPDKIAKQIEEQVYAEMAGSGDGGSVEESADSAGQGPSSAPPEVGADPADQH